MTHGICAPGPFADHDETRLSSYPLPCHPSSTLRVSNNADWTATSAEVICQPPLQRLSYASLRDHPREAFEEIPAVTVCIAFAVCRLSSDYSPSAIFYSPLLRCVLPFQPMILHACDLTRLYTSRKRHGGAGWLRRGGCEWTDNCMQRGFFEVRVVGRSVFITGIYC